jgi:hypothetical protein
MPPKKSPKETQPLAPQRPRARKRATSATTEPQPVAPASQRVAPPRPSPRWFTPAAIALAVALLIGILLEISPLDLAAAEDRLLRMEAMVDSTAAGGTTMQERLASAEKVARLCREGLLSMVRMWNRYVQELKASEARPARFRAARRRFDTAQKEASLAVQRCEDA